MDFSYVHKQDSASIKIKSDKYVNFDENPYIRRYFLIKIALQSMGVALASHFTKLIFQNMRGYKYFKMSPWLELAAGAIYYNCALRYKFITDTQKDNQLLKLNSRHFRNSQYWH